MVTRKELTELHQLVTKNLDFSISSLVSADNEMARSVVEGQPQINALERRLHESHIERLHSGVPESIESSSLHLDVIYSLRRINTRTTGIAEFVLGKERGEES